MIEKPESIAWSSSLETLAKDTTAALVKNDGADGPNHLGLRIAYQWHKLEALRVIAEKLNVIERYVTLFVETNVVVKGELLSGEHEALRRAHEQTRTTTNLLEALGLVRLVLDTGGPGLPGSPNAQRLFEAEHLLSRELGQPIWDSPLRPEGRRS